MDSTASLDNAEEEKSLAPGRNWTKIPWSSSLQTSHCSDYSYL